LSKNSLYEKVSSQLKTIDQSIQETFDRPNSPFKLLQDGNIKHLYFNKLAKAESVIQSVMGERFQISESVVNKKLLKKSLNSVLFDFCLRSNENEDSRYYMNLRQRVAVALACLKNTIVITGGPGTGKTSVVVQIIRTQSRLDPELRNFTALCAPTGRAAARLQESLSRSVQGLQYYQTSDAIEKRFLEEDNALSQLEGSTVHRLLGYNPKDASFRFNSENKLNLKLLILDEASMLDIHLFSALLGALPIDCKLILLGDRNQLPSVDSGAVLGDFTDVFYQGNFSTLSQEMAETINQLLPPIPEHEPNVQQLITTTQHIIRDHLVVLTESHRSEKTILELATQINNENSEECKRILLKHTINISSEINWPIPQMDTQGKLRCLPSGVQHIAISEDNFEGVLNSWATVHFTNSLNPFRNQDKWNNLKYSLDCFCRGQDSDKLIIKKGDELYDACIRLHKALDESRILCTTKEGPRGTFAINDFISKICSRVLDPDNKNQRLFQGLPLIITRNANHLNLYNGDTGLFIRCDERFYGLFRQGDFFEKIPVHQLPSWEPAYAMTVHKSQGSEYEHLLLILPETENRLMSREILYTAITRAKYFAGVAGDINLFGKSVQNRIQRDSGIPEYFDQLS
jgi:exodeoxyribonuclease V alpha subunit